MAEGSNPLSRFELSGVEEKGREIGRGSYAVVEELDFRGLSCVGKSIHEELYDNASDRERVDMLARFAAECELLSQVRHPHVVQFVGVHYKQGSRLPVLVMERLDSTLSDCLERYGKLLDEVGYPVIRDVAVGLCYLHGYTPSPIVHRDLTANNILLTSDMKAKISDLGMAKILNLNPARMAQMTTCPGTPSYMPPEALVTKPIYTTKVDIFSYGNLMTHVFSGVWPIPTSVFRVDPSSPSVMVPATEVERREEYLQDMGDTHPLIALTKQCLSNNPLTRPEAPVVLARINEVMPQFPSSFRNKMEMLQQIEAERRILKAQIKQHQRQIEKKDLQITQLQMSHSLEKDRTHTGMGELSTEIDRLRVTRTQQEPVSPKMQQTLQLHPHSRLRWRRGTNLPAAMKSHHIVRIGNKIYCGGGYTDKRSTSRQVFEYDPERGQWLSLPICPTKEFGLTQLDGKLVTVGGSRLDHPIPINDVYVFEESQTWEKSIPPLPTARFYPTAFAYKSTLVVSVGITHWKTDSKPKTRTTAVEVFQSKSSQWYCAEPLPLAHSSMSHAIINDTCYLVGGGNTGGASRRVYCISLPSLIETAVPHDHGVKASSSPQASPRWQVLRHCPLGYSTVVELGGCLVAIGGRDSSKSPSSKVHMYSPSTNSWVRMSSGDLPVPRYYAAATQLETGEVIFVGGEEDETKLATSIFIASIEQ